MQAKFTPPTSPKKPMPTVLHRRQMIWQVWLPLLVSIIAVLTLAILAIAAATVGNPQLQVWADVSAVIVIAPWLIVGIVVFAIVGGSSYAIFYLLKEMPGWLLKAQLFMLQVALTVRRIADAIAKPVVSVNTFSARVSALWHKLAGTAR